MPEIKIIDETEDELIPFRYSITSYGADYPVDSLVKRLDKEVLFVPEFQRKFVWTLKQASKFIESLLLGLPVPGVFFAREDLSGKLLIIDGQQRLKTLQCFYDGLFRDKQFALNDVQTRWVGRTYKTLQPEDQVRLDDSIIHATIIRQDEPSDDQSSVYHIFERLNTGGTLLQPQEIRACIFHGVFNEFLKELDSTQAWRKIYGPPSKRLKDQELILRFFALHFDRDKYSRPMKEFLSKWMGSNRDLSLISDKKLRRAFVPTVEVINEVLGSRAFRPQRALNAAVYDSVMVALAHRLKKGKIKSPASFRKAYDKLVSDKDYLSAVSTGTADEANVKKRLEKAIIAFHKVR